jgi:hypothetical protein
MDIALPGGLALKLRWRMIGPETAEITRTWTLTAAAGDQADDILKALADHLAGDFPGTAGVVARNLLFSAATKVTTH